MSHFTKIVLIWQLFNFFYEKQNICVLKLIQYSDYFCDYMNLNPSNNIPS